MITDVEYMQIVNEVYDLSDYATKKKVLFCNEAKKTDNLEHIVNRLYNHIKSNTTAIDFGTIPRSKGIVTRVDNYTQVVDCINSIHDLVMSYHESTKLVDELSTALANIQQRERLFTKAFALNIEFPIMIYNMTVLSVISATSLMISSSIEYIKNGHDSFLMSLDKTGYVKTKDNVLYEYVVQFNRICADGSLDKAMNECVKNNVVSESTEILDEDFTDVAKGIAGLAVNGGAVAGGASMVLKAAGKSKIARIALIIIGAGMALIGFINLLRKVIYWWCKAQMKLSDWFDIQATYLQINAENMKYRDDPKGEDHKKETYQRQIKWVEKFRKISNSLMLKSMKAEKEAQKEDADYSRKRKYEDDEDTYDDGGLF